MPVGPGEDVFSEDTLQKLQHIIPPLLRTRPWFLGRRRYITGLSLQNVLALPETAAHLLFLNVEYGDGDPEVYLVPISVATGDRSEAILHDRPDVVLARLDGPGPEDHSIAIRRYVRPRLQRFVVAGHRPPPADQG